MRWPGTWVTASRTFDVMVDFLWHPETQVAIMTITTHAKKRSDG